MQNLVSLFIACILIIVICTFSAVIYAQPHISSEVATLRYSDLDRRVEKVEILALDNYTKVTRLHGIGIGVSFVILVLQFIQISGLTIKRK